MTIVLTTVSILIVIAVVTIAYIAVFEVNRSKEITLIGACNSTVYILPDTLSISTTNITTISNHTTLDLTIPQVHLVLLLDSRIHWKEIAMPAVSSPTGQMEWQPTQCHSPLQLQLKRSLQFTTAPN